MASVIVMTSIWPRTSFRFTVSTPQVRSSFADSCKGQKSSAYLRRFHRVCWAWKLVPPRITEHVN